MKRRSKDSGEPANARSPKAAKLKRRNEATRLTSSAAAKDGEVARLTRELKEALEQQSATADVLRMISSSPIEVQRVLDVIVRTAAELCASEYSILFRLQDGKYHVACSNKAGAEFVKFFLEHPISMDRASLVGRTALERRSVHIQDCLADPEYRLHEAARLGKHRTMLGVPLLREGIPIGVIGLNGLVTSELRRIFCSDEGEVVPVAPPNDPPACPAWGAGRIEPRTSGRPERPSVLRVRADCGGRLFAAKFASSTIM